MISALELSPTDSVLEIGTGSGYQTAILAKLAKHVYTVERHHPLADAASSVLARLGFHNVTVIAGDGTQGLRQYAPYSAIVVSAAAVQIPEALLDQLQDGGRMVIPVGPSGVQQLQLVRKIDGKIHLQTLENCRFVPLVTE